jgi:hypothetical protein
MARRWTGAFLIWWLAAATVSLGGETPARAQPVPVPSPAAPATLLSGIARWFDLESSPFIPIPEVGTDPNAGTTIGFLPVFLVTNRDQRIERIYAPDVIVNPNFGYGARGRVFGYPSDDTQWYVVGGGKERVEREFDALYTTGLTRAGAWSLSARSVYDRSGSRRFWGFGNDTPQTAETNYTNEQAYLEATAGYNISHVFQIALNLRPRHVRIEPGRLGDNPSIETTFPSVTGLGSGHELLARLIATYDTRDSISVPSKGTQLSAIIGAAERAALSSRSYSVIALDARHFWPIHDRVVLAGHAALRYMPQAAEAPFWALSSLGGDRSVLGERQPLRGYGEDRFVDRHAFSASLEVRTRVYDLHLFGTDLTLELAPFLDAGRVFHDLDDNPFRSLHAVGGIGVRAVARPFLVGYVDVGYGGEGVAVFSGLGYAF